MAASEEKGKSDAISQEAENVVCGSPTEGEQVLSAEAALKAISERVAAEMNMPMILRYPSEVRRRIRALKRLQFQTQELEAKFYLDVQELEAKYQKLYQPLYDRRRDVINGSYEPTDEEAHWSEDEYDEDPTVPDKKATETSIDSSRAGTSSTVKGVDQFWMTALRNCDMFLDTIKDYDEPVLAHLTDVKVVYADDKGLDFRLEFFFSENEWFTNKVLVKSYKVACEVNKRDPWSFEGAAITSGEGCKIDWKKGKDLTVKTVKKKVKRGKSQAKTTIKTVPNDTFFNMFSDLDPKVDPLSDEGAAFLSDDYTRAEFLRDRLIPKAVLFFTGDATDADPVDDDFDEEDSTSDDLGDDYDPQNDLNKSKPPECKQQ